MTVQSPVVFVVFNRPEVTKLSFARIAEARPSRLFLIADGPRKDVPSDVERCSEVRSLVAEIDWPCTVHRDFADRNMGLKNRFVTGLTWVFSQVERCIVLEDDCVAHPDFFEFCDELLDRYSQAPEVAAITGNNFQRGPQVGDASYYFSRYFHCWGWASWKRTWDNFQPDLDFWPDWKGSDDWQQAFEDPIERRYWERIFDRVAGGEIDSWAYPMQASLLYRGGLTATPNANLVTNIGFGANASHTRNPNSIDQIPLAPMKLVRHPHAILRSSEADKRLFEKHLGGERIRERRTVRGFVRWAYRGGRRKASEIANWLFSRSRT